MAAPVTVDVAVIGAGLAGTSTAAVLGKAGRSVALIDPHAVFLPEFRAEKIGPAQIGAFTRLGLGDTVLNVMTPMDDLHVYRFGRLFQRVRKREYGFAYDRLVNALRGALPGTVRFLAGKVAAVETGPDRQRIVLTDGRTIEARLLVLATGYGESVRRMVGLRRVETAKSLSLTIGFTMAHPAAAYPFGTLTAYGRRVEDRIAYLSLFPIGTAMRGNLFLYREVSDPWTKAFRADPKGALSRLMPEIAHLCHGFEIAGPVEVRAVPLSVTEGHIRDGVVAVGDAFCTTCPTPGVGIDRVMSDVERLCAVHAPRWLATPGMGVDKIAAYYDDPIKREVDAKGMAASLHARHITVDTSFAWTALRWRNAGVRGAILAFAVARRLFDHGHAREA